MILPNVRASFGRSEATLLLGLLARDDHRSRDRLQDRLRDDGFDAVLDDPRTLNAVLATSPDAAVPPRLVFYLLVRHALLETGIDDRTLADYLAAMLIDFGTRRVDEATGADRYGHVYLVDILQAIDTADGRRAFLLRTHLGNYALWLSGLYPDYVTARVARRGAPGLGYYEEMGTTSFRQAAESRLAGDHGLDGIFRTCAERFPHLRVALNRIADRYLFPQASRPVERLLRQVADSFHGRERLPEAGEGDRP